MSHRENLAALADSAGGIELMHAYSDLTDALISRIFELATADAGPTAARIAIAAVGGYGRREMSPFSDVDVAFLASAEEDQRRDLVAKRAFRALMEVLESAAVKVGYSYRLVDDVHNLPLETQTALLEARCVAGSHKLFKAFSAALRDAIVPAAFVIEHVESRQFGPEDTPFVVEPDVKEGRGGLRDLHASRWIAQVAFALPPESVWEGLRACGVLLDPEIVEIRRATEFMSRTRNILHLIAGRPLDILTLTRHDQVARMMGFEDSAEFDSRYYAHARHLSGIHQKIAQACLAQSLTIEPGVVARGGELHVTDHGLLSRDASAALRVLRHAQNYRLGVGRESRDLLARCSRPRRFTRNAAATFLDIISSSGAASSLRLMAELNMLEWVVPQFGDLMHLLPGDAAHRYTVGEHSLRTVRELETLLSDPGDQFADIFSRVQNFEVLFLAALMHDIGKLDARRDHARTGAFRAARLARRLGMSEDACSKVDFLVRNHLKMSETARLRDLHQQRTVRDFASLVGDQQLLDMLLLLTVADSRAVGTTNWSRVQVRFLLELHERTMAALRLPDSRGADLDRHRQRVRRELCLSNLPSAEVDEHCASMPASYLLNTSPEELALHIGFVRAVRGGSPVTSLRDDPRGHFTKLTVLAPDRPGLLSDITGVLHAMKVDVHAAQIFTRDSFDRIAIDLLYIDFEGRQLSETMKWQVEGNLASVLTGSLSVDDLMRRCGRRRLESASGLEVKALDDLSDHHKVLEIHADDAPGLLHFLTRRISDHGLDIHSARVATWGHRVRDVFYVTKRDGSVPASRDVDLLADAICHGAVPAR